MLFSKFGFAHTELQMGKDEFILVKETDIIGIMPKADAIADDIPELQPLHDRVLIKVNESAEVTSGALCWPYLRSSRACQYLLLHILCLADCAQHSTATTLPLCTNV